MADFKFINANELPAVASVTENDMILVIQGGQPKRALPSAMRGKAGNPGVSSYLGVTATYIRWKMGVDGVWQNLISIASLIGPRGEKPIFRKVNGTLQMKYAGEPDTAYVNIFDREELTMKFADLTPAEVNLLKLHFADLTEADKAELMKPATDAASDARTAITDLRQLATTVEEQEGIRETSYIGWQAKEQTRQNNEETRNIAEAVRVSTEELRDDAEGIRITDEELRKSAEIIRGNAEKLRVTEEGKRAESETIRKEAEQGRIIEEGKRKEAESLRVGAETLRSRSEVLRNNAEHSRDEAETHRIAEETDRDEAEVLRIQMEDQRIESEKSRLVEEKKRVLAETSRTEAENKRQTDTTEAVDRLDSLSDHRDIIKDSYWWHWSEATKEYEKTENRADGNILFASFYVDLATGELSATTPDGYDGPVFELDSRGDLCVIV